MPEIRKYLSRGEMLRRGSGHEFMTDTVDPISAIHGAKCKIYGAEPNK
jgi:hypothetical protein